MGVVETSAQVKKQREATDGIVAGAASIELQRRIDKRSIVIPRVDGQRPSASTVVGGGRRLGEERQPTNRCVECVIRLLEKSVEPFRGVARCKVVVLRKHLWQKRNAGKHGQDCSEYDIPIFH